jgi:hypothetical protein
VKTSQAEIQHLAQLVQQISGRVNLLEVTLMQVKEHAESGVSSLAKKLDELESFFSQGFTRFVDRSSVCSEELKVTRIKSHDHVDEQKGLLKERRSKPTVNYSRTLPRTQENEELWQIDMWCELN